MSTATQDPPMSQPGEHALVPKQRRASDSAPANQTISQRPTPNVADGERMVSLAAGGIAALLGLSRGSLPGLLVAGVGSALMYRGATGHCSLYEKMDINTARGLPTGGAGMRGSTPAEIAQNGFHVQQAFLVNKPAEELYRFWRNFENLPRIMTHLETVRVLDEKRSHWVVKAPSITGGKVEWDAEIVKDEPNKVIAWKSLPGSDVDNAGQVTFEKAPGDRGTSVRVSFDYVPPAGRLGNWIATLFGEAPARQAREDLRNFKRVMEIGEVLSIVGQPQGSCSGSEGTRYKE